MQNSKIEWTDHTFNPWHGCQRVSPGCEHCYAETLNHRYGFNNWGPAKTTERRPMSANYWKQPLRWDEAARKAGQRARVFCASMADVFEDHPQLDDLRARLWELIEQIEDLDWLLLTKRPENVIGHRLGPMVPNDWLYEHVGFPHNVWIGTSVEDQRRADERIPELLRIPARVRFLSCEPLLGPVDLSAWLICERCKGEGRIYHTTQTGRQSFIGRYIACPDCVGTIWRRDLHWVIAGGESGHGARPMHPDWARWLRDDCQNAGVPFFFKQWGEYGWARQAEPAPTHNPERLIKYGKHAAGRLLDGREWSELPANAARTRSARRVATGQGELFELSGTQD